MKQEVLGSTDKFQARCAVEDAMLDPRPLVTKHCRGSPVASQYYDAADAADDDHDHGDDSADPDADADLGCAY